MLIVGLDPGLACTGWPSCRLKAIGCALSPRPDSDSDSKATLPARLVKLDEALAPSSRPMGRRRRGRGSLSERHPQSPSLKLGPGPRRDPACRRAAGAGGRRIFAQYVKKAVVGTGAAQKARSCHGAKIASRREDQRPGRRRAFAVAITTPITSPPARHRLCRMIARLQDSSSVSVRSRHHRRRRNRLSRVRIEPHALSTGARARKWCSTPKCGGRD